ncbi:helix-turn-helix domain-containing protein [Solibacillus silvestris]|uniref:helix-turn-helix domain-containing protein n=1 Tax=Solibacillus TaxID=648800 RepID=UPI0030FA4B4E
MLIRKIRQENDWKLIDLAEKLDISFSSLSKIENGTQDITYTMLRKICNQFDLSLSQFFRELEHSINIEAEANDLEEIDILLELTKEIEKLSVVQQKALYILLKQR